MPHRKRRAEQRREPPIWFKVPAAKVAAHVVRQSAAVAFGWVDDAKARCVCRARRNTEKPVDRLRDLRRTLDDVFVARDEQLMIHEAVEIGFEEIGVKAA